MKLPPAVPCEVHGCRGVMHPVAHSPDRRTWEFSCDKGAHTWVRLAQGTKRADSQQLPHDADVIVKGT